MRRSWILAVAGLALVLGCEDNTPRRQCATDIAVGEVQAFGEQTPLVTEGITFTPDGALYISGFNRTGLDQLYEFAPDGSFTVVAQVQSMLGLENDGEDVIAAGIETGELLRIDTATNVASVVADGLGAPNFVVTTPWDTWLVSDDTFEEETIDEVTFEGVATTWVTGVPTPNGMVFSLDGSELYVATTFSEPGLWRVPVNEDGTPGTPAIWVEFDEGTTPDGVAIDSEGNVYVALNIVNQIVRVDSLGNVTPLAQVGTPASLAFGQGNFDPCSLYVTNLFGNQIWRVGAGVLGVEK